MFRRFRIILLLISFPILIGANIEQPIKDDSLSTQTQQYLDDISDFFIAPVIFNGDDDGQGIYLEDGNLGWYNSGELKYGMYRGGTNMMYLRSYSTTASDDYSIFWIWSPSKELTADQEATLTLMRSNLNDDNNSEFIDFYNNGYNSTSKVNYGFRIQKRGSGSYRDLLWEFSDGTTVTEAMRLYTPTNIRFRVLGQSIFQTDKTSLSASQDNSQLSLRGNTTSTKELALGYDTSNNKGFIQSRNFGISYDPLALQPLGGAVEVGTGGSANKAMCWKNDGVTLGYCSSVVAADGSCTCN